MKIPLLVPAPRLLLLRYLPAFFWVEQEPTPVWMAAGSGSSTDWVQAVGTATEVGGAKFVAWSSTNTLRMGGATTTAAADYSITVHTTT